jgi:ligand-binding sensor domain-containing protein/two-component sensor histidine kinase
MARFILINPLRNIARRRRRKRGRAFLFWLVAWIVCTSATSHAEQLPIKVYTTAEGLVRDSINRIAQDSRGFLWFCTMEGLSRFDGYGFTNYTTEQGLPHRSVNDLLETRDGAYWLATGGGVCRFNPAGSSLFTLCDLRGRDGSQDADVLVEDRAGTIWCGTHAGLYRFNGTAGQFELVDVGMPTEAEGDYIHAMILDHQGALWFGTRTSGLYRRWPDGSLEHYTTRDRLPDNRIDALLEDRSGHLWVGTPEGLCCLVNTPRPNRPLVGRVYTARDGLAANGIDSIFQSADGTIWVGGIGLSELLPRESRESRESGESGESAGFLRHQKVGNSHKESFQTYTMANGLSGHLVLALAEDRDGNLWLGTNSDGAMKLVRSGFTSYTTGDGLAAVGVDAIVEDRSGELCAISSGLRHFINRFEGRRFTFVWPDFPKRINNFGWGRNQITFQDHLGDWWMPTGRGLCRFPPVARLEDLATTPPRRVYTTRNGLPFNDIFRLYEDSHGDVWISSISSRDNGLSRWERASDTIYTFPHVGAAQEWLRTHPATAFAEDAAGNLWIGAWGGGLMRYSAGRFALFNERDGLPAGTVRDLYLDHAHRLWVAVPGGLARVDDPAAARPHFELYGMAQGLSSNDAFCVTEDQWGHVYVGTGRGVDRLDPDTGEVRRYTTADGLLRGNVATAYRDRHGVLWFAGGGLSRLIPRLEAPPPPPPALISGLRIGGVAHPVSQLGETEIGSLDLAPGQNQLNIDFVAVSYAPGEVLRYQYKLEGADRDWSLPSDQRTVNYPNLAPGGYRFLVRAVTAEGLTSETPAIVAFTIQPPAIVAFTIQPPVWRRWWFMSMAAIVAGLAIYGGYRARVARLLELERVRTRIATDLHDDIGANLSLIAMVSEVARGHLHREDARMREWFSTISTTSRDTVDAMSDIVWAVNPKRDHVSDLTHRMRRFAEDMFAARDIELRFHAPEPGRNPKVGADLRREVFLIFKESINNIVRHSRCNKAEIELETDHRWLVLQVRDDGRGFDVTGTPEGNGLASMRQRATRLRGSLELSSNGKGASVTLRVPLSRR